MGDPAPLLTVDQFEEILRTNLAGSHQMGMRVAAIGWGRCTVVLPFEPRFLRPGGTISGPTMFSMVDTALWGATMSVIGPVVMAVTYDVTIHFLRRPEPATLTAECQLIKRGRRLCTGRVEIFSAGLTEPVAHAVGSYALPPDLAARD